MTSRLVGPPLPPPPVATLAAAAEALGERPGPWLHVVRGEQVEPWTGAALLTEARRWAGTFVAAGVRPQDRVGLWLPNDARFVSAFFGATLLGAVAVPLAWPATLARPADALAPLLPLVDVADVAVFVTDAAVADAVPAHLRVLTAPDAEPWTGPGPGPDDLAFLQFTSGSTGRPRGAAIPHRAAVASAWAMGLQLGLGPDDVGVSWLPLFHDMGLVGALFCPLLFGFPLHLMPPAAFLLHPDRWIAKVSEVRGTIAAAPDFAWAMAARRALPKVPVDLSCWRHALDGAEPVHRPTLDAFAEKYGAVGFVRGALRPVYGLAENTLGVCFSRPDDRDDVVLDGRHVPASGTPLPGMEVEVLAEEGRPGPIRVRGPALMAGYFRDPDATAAALVDGWLLTGDLGVIRDGRLFVTGREKDLIIRHGRKFHPYDIERIAAEAAASPPNGAAAFAVDGEDAEALVVVVETRAEDAAARVRAELLATLGIRADRIHPVAPGTLPRTTSGKLRRGEVRAAWGAA